MGKLKPGERDAKGRVFLGWRMTVDGQFRQFFARRKAVIDVAPAWRKRGYRVTVARVYRRESPIRRALREILEAIDQNGAPHPIGATLYKRAVEALKG